MKSRVFRLVASVATLLGLALAVPVLAAAPAQAASCPQSGPTFAQAGAFTYQAVNIRSGPTTGCVAVGLGYSSHNVTYRCYSEGTPVNGWSTWTYLTDNTTGVTGWSSDAFLAGGGSWYHC